MSLTNFGQPSRRSTGRRPSQLSLSGAVLVFEVDDADQVDSELWHDTDDVLICAESVEYKGKSHLFYTFINTDENGEKVDAQRLR
jgi:hypothetical protein